MQGKLMDYTNAKDRWPDRVGKCRKCGAELLFVSNYKTGNVMPMDSVPVQRDLVDEHGRYAVVGDSRVCIATKDEYVDPCWIIHHAVCPFSNTSISGLEPENLRRWEENKARCSFDEKKDSEA